MQAKYTMTYGDKITRTRKKVPGRLAQRMAWIVICSMAFTMASWGQTGAGLSGVITDASGAVVPKAAVTAENQQTGAVRHTETDSRGSFSISNLDIGQYALKVDKAGFQSQSRKGITLDVGAQPEEDFKLIVGTSEQTVTVEAATAGVETNTTELSSLVDQRQIRDLPLNGRNFEQLILLSPGAAPVGASTQNSTYGRNISYSISGSRASDQSFLLDGQDIQGFWGHGAGNTMTGNSLGVEAIAEYQTITSSYGAQYGGSGSVINAATRSGANTVHGSAYDYLRNSVFDALNRFDSPVVPIKFRRNQFGASIGGPIRKNKDFFFGNYEGYREALGQSVINSVPDANGHLGLIGTTQYAVSPVIAPYLALYPACTPGLIDTPATSTCQFRNINATSRNEDYANVRVDHHFSDTNSIFARYVFDNGAYTNPLANTVVPGWPELDKSSTQFIDIVQTTILSANLINIASINFGRNNTSAQAPGNNPLFQFYPGRQNGAISVTGIASLGSPASTSPVFYLQNKYSISDSATWQRGKHSLQFGIEIRRIESNFAFPNSSGGAFTFSGGLAAFIQDKPASFRGIASNADLPERGMRELQAIPFVEDVWKATSRLTVNLGVRYEFISNPTEVHSLLSAVLNFATDTNFTPVSNAFISNPAKKNIDPRVGFAFDVFGNHKSSLRGGYGIYHIILEPREYNNNYSNSAPLVPVSITNPVFPLTTANASIPAVNFGMDYHTNVTPYMMQYDLNIEQELASHLFLTVAYVGSVGHNLLIAQNLNPPVPTVTNGVYTTAKPNVLTNPAFSFIDETRPIASSNYNSMQTNLKHTFSMGLDAQVSYTFSKFLDNGSGSGSGFEGQLSGSGEGSNPYTIKPDYGRSNFDVRHNMAFNAVYQLPFKGSRFKQGYQINSIFTAHSGFPFSVRNGVAVADQLNTSGQERPNVVPGKNPYPATKSATEWFDPTAFSIPAAGTFGNLGRNTFSGPNCYDLDLGVGKLTSFPSMCEVCAVQLRAELFNIVNHPNLGLPNGAIFSSIAGAVSAAGPTITSTSGNSTARQAQFSLKMIF